MRAKILLVVCASLFAVSTSFAVPTKVNKGPIRAATFNFPARVGKSVGFEPDNREAVHKMIQAAIVKNLGARGIKRVQSGGDITVAYLLIKGDNASTEAIRDYFGYSNDFGDLHDKAQDKYTGARSRDRFQAGTLLIDIVDRQTGKLMKRGYTTRPIAPNLSDKARAARIQQGVDEILGDAKFAK